LAIPNLSLFAGCVAIWSTTWLAITFQPGGVPPEVSVAWRFLLAALVAVGFSAGPLLSMFGLRLFFGQPLTLRMTLGALTGIAGIALVFWPEVGRLSHAKDAGAGAMFFLAAVVVSTVGGLLAHRNHRRGLHGLPCMAWSMGYGGLLSLALAMALGRRIGFDLSAGYVLSLLYLALVGSVAAFACWLTLIGRVGPARASYVGVMVPVVALALSTLFEHLEWNPLMVAGMVVSVAGNVLVLRGPADAASRSSAP